MSDVNFDMDTILAEAQQKTGLDDYGSDDFLPGLNALLQTYAGNDFTAAGQGASRSRVLNLLIARLNIEAAWKRQPEVLGLEIKKPMFLTGMPRTGTSALLNLLSNDPATRTLKLWEGLNPWPLENLQAGQEDPRYLAVKAGYEAMNKTSDFKKMHYTTADTPEECIHLTNHTFQDAQFGVEIFLEPYASYYCKVGRRPQYQYHADLLRLLQWQRPAERWLLKTPSHICHLDILVQQYPDCEIIITHRNPLNIIGSYCSLMMGVMPERKNADSHDLGQRVLNHLAGQMGHSMEIRKSISAERILDIQYNDFINDSQAVADGIYQHFSLPYSDATRQLIASYIADHPRGKHGSHDYQLEQFGLNEQQVLDRFAGYIDEFDIAV